MTTIKSMTKYVLQHPILWVIGLVVPSFASLATNLFFAYGMEAYTAELIKPDAAFSKAASIMIVTLVSLLISTIIEDIARYIFALFAAKTENHLKQDLYSSVVFTKFQELSKLDRGEFFERYNKDTATTSYLISWDIFSVIFPIVLGTGYLISIFNANALIGFIMLALVIAVIILNAFFVNRFRILEKRALQAREGFTQICDSVIQGKMTLRQMSAGDRFAQKINVESGYMYDIEDDVIKLNTKKAVSLELFSTVCSTLMAPLACVFATLNWITLPGIVLIAQLCRYLIIYTNNFGIALTSFASHSISYTRLRTIWDMPRENVNEGDTIDVKDENVLELKNVGVSYGENMILHDANFTVKPSEIIALVGSSGSGKSSIIKALLRLIDYSGEIKLFGNNVNQLSLLELRQSISYVPEQNDLFDTTVLENISFANLDADDEQIRNVLLGAALGDETDFVDREVGENGSKLSGGQRQRVAIARALIKDASLIIFDEPTASLDAVSENKILETIQQLKSNEKSVILITHRGSTLKIADRIFYIQDKTITS